jgi:hypothetical protein
MDNVFLVTRPKYDDGTEYLSYYASLTIKEAENRGIKVKDFEGKKVNKEIITKFIEKVNPQLLFINGHGDETSLYGHDDNLLFSVDNLNLLKGKLTYARACNAGEVLGKEVVKGNDGCFIGYKYPFSFWIDPKWSAKPNNDNIAKLYLEPSNEVVISLIRGKNSQEANEKSKKMMLDNMRKILKLEEKKEPGAMGMLQILWNNFDGQVLHGNSSAKFI